MRAMRPCLITLLALLTCALGLADKPKPRGDARADRRMLGISVCQYLYLPTGSFDSDAPNARNDFGTGLALLGRAMKIPEAQTYELSDCSQGKKRTAPTREAIEQMIGQFLDGSRANDQVVVMFVGQQVELDGTVYLIPIDGDIKTPASMMPLDWFYKKLEACPARQKVLIVDVNRFDPIRGFAHAQPLSQAAESALKKPPKGVQVWSACSAGQYSLKVREPRKIDGGPIQGGLFQSILLRDASGGKDNPPAGDLIPLEALADRVNSGLSRAVTALALSRFKQVSFVAGEVADGDSKADGDRKTSPPQLPAWPADAVPMSDVQAILHEIEASAPSDLPGDESVKDDVIALLPFSKKAMQPYGSDAVTDEEVAAKPSDYPLRAAIQRASAELRTHAKDDGLRPISSVTAAELNAPKSQARNNLTRLQRGPARRLQVLEEILADLDKAAEQRAAEKSPRWQAQFDLFRARMLAQYARAYEYNSAIGIVRKDALPALDEKNGEIGWRLICQETMQSGSDAKESARSAAKLYAKIIHDHPDTPWALAARREKSQPMGLTWAPTADIVPALATPPKRK